MRPGDDLYQTLEVQRGATEREMKKAYRRLSMLYHPDKNPDNPEVAQAKFVEVAHAYEILSDAARRDKYDVHGSAMFRQGDGTTDGGNFQMDPFDLFTMTMATNPFAVRRFSRVHDSSYHSILCLRIQPAFARAAQSRLEDVRSLQCGSANEGYSFKLMCLPRARIVKIKFASYGTPTGACSTGGGPLPDTVPPACTRRKNKQIELSY